ncbi:AraC family transcriptional regulator [Verrucomicrobia bacterium]|nr:AraC family transcriptional regulator [Verrucomicrobiota bacterium]
MNAENTQAEQTRFLRSIAEDSHFHLLLEYIPGVSFFAKNDKSQIMRANRNFLERFGFKEEFEIIGRSDFELFPEGLAENFRRDDLEVMESREPKIHIVELFLNRQGLVDWFVTNKLPIVNRKGDVIGVMGTVQDYELQRRISYPYPEIERAVAIIREDYSEPLKMAELAKKVGLSVRQFDRKFQQALSISPKSFLIKTRIQAGCELLRQTALSVGEVAQELAFSDQSSFTLLFRREMGMTPLKYRQRYQR